MKKLTAEKCRESIQELKFLDSQRVLPSKGCRYLQALQIALPILEQQESEGATNE